MTVCYDGKFGVGRFGISKFGHICGDEVATDGRLYTAQSGNFKRKTDMYSNKTSTFKRRIF